MLTGHCRYTLYSELTPLLNISKFEKVLTHTNIKVKSIIMYLLFYCVAVFG